jgi:transcriptional regulator with XRE-family HTH domain
MRAARRIREEQGFSLVDVTRLTSVTGGHLSVFERGEAGMGIDKLQELARLYQCSLDDLVAEAEPTPVAAEG